MQTLVFNTTKKTVELYDGSSDNSKFIKELSNVPTVKVQDGYYEVMQRDDDDLSSSSSSSRTIPVLRVPIAKTNMIIEK